MLQVRLFDRQRLYRSARLRDDNLTRILQCLDLLNRFGACSCRPTEMLMLLFSDVQEIFIPR